MANDTSFDSMTLTQLRAVGEKEGLVSASELTKRELIRHLGRLKANESTSKVKILSTLKEYRVKGINQVPKPLLDLLAVHAQRLEDMKLIDLRPYAKKNGLDGSPQLTKKSIISQLLQSYLERLSVRNVEEVVQEKIPVDIESIKKLPWSKWLGRTIYYVSIIAVLVGLLFMALTPLLASRSIKLFSNVLSTISVETQSVSATIKQVSQTIEEGSQALVATVTSLRNIEKSIDDTRPLINSTSELVGDHTPTMIENTLEALITAEESARAVDQVLRNLARLGPLTGVSYSPNQPLNVGIARITDSLEPLPAVLREVSLELSSTGTSLDRVGNSLGKVGDEIDGFTNQLTVSSVVLKKITDDLETFSRELNLAQGRLKSVIILFAILVEVLLTWFVLGQIAIAFIGRQLSRQTENNQKT